MIYFKTGKFATKTYDLCPGRMIYMKTGKYILDVKNDVLIAAFDDLDDIKLNDIGLLQFYIDLNVDFGRDERIDLILDRKGQFTRTDGISGFSSIENLFSCTE